jgi:hypothetical protein
MSTIFSYDIDERNLRVQLKNLEIPLKEEAWQKFEIYSQSNAKTEQTPFLQNLQFGLSRNVVMPAIFGSIILLFSLLLYNFVSIKKDKEQQETISSLPPLENASEPEPEVVSTAPEVQTTLISTEEMPVPETLPAEVTAPAETPVPEAPAITTNSETRQAEAAERKRQRRRERETLSAIKPSIITEEAAEVEMPQ